MISATHKTRLFLRLFASLGLGIIWALAYPTWSMVGFAWIAPVCLIAIGAGCKSKHIFGWSFLASWAQSATVLYWLLNMPHLPAAIAGWLSLSAYVACYPALWAWLVWRKITQLRIGVHPDKPPDILEWIRSLTLINAQYLALWGAALWGGMELAVSHLLTGFPWLLLGATQLPWTPLAQTAALGGVPMISFIIVWTSLSLGIGIARSRLTSPSPWKWMADVIVPAGVIGLLSIYGYERIKTIDASRPAESFRVALIQPAFPQTLIWNSQEDQSRFDDLLSLSEAALKLEPDLLVWPEGAFSGNIESFVPVWDLLDRHQAWLCFNGTDVDVTTLDTEDPTTFNAAFLMDPSGKLTDTYHKRHLVMFGEFVPLSQWFPFLKMLTPIQHLFTPGKQSKTFSMPLQNVQLYPLICFEDVMPYLTRGATRQQIDFLLNLTNDGWFKESAAQFQHASLAAFRSIETGLPMIRCGNNGLTCWIDPTGQLHGMAPSNDSTDIYGRGFRVLEIPKGWAVKPPIYQSIGKFFSWGCLFSALALWFVQGRKYRAKA